MNVVKIFERRLPHHPLLGWHARQDSRSLAYALQPKQTPIVDVLHEAFIGILDQGRIGACSGNGSLSCAYHAPFFASGAPNWTFTADEPGALGWYARNTAEDDYPGTFTYPPPGGDDTGSDSLTSSKVAVEIGVASGYQAALDLTSSLEALMDKPGITGIPWYQGMFDVPSSGLVTVDTKTGLAGGHLLCANQVITASAPGNGTGKLLVGGPQSWGTGWGDSGRWYMTADDWWMLRQQQGDFYSWTPAHLPAPQPTPGADTDPFDLSMWQATGPFRHDRHTLPHIRAAAHALAAWGEDKGLPA